jgi:hypothetical protein
MLPLLLLLISAQVPAVPGEGTLVSFCKQGRLTACQELAKVNPGKAAEIQSELAKAARSLEALRAADEEARDKEDAKADESSEAAAESGAEASDEPPNCTGQEHHIISRLIAKELARHKTLRGLYTPRDKRFKTRAKDKESHCGYQEWHREVDTEVIEWLKEHEKATPEQFMKMLRELYNRPDMLKRFPNGF